ncbi:efflux RND transporter periplasmic adaptor subunit, partial [Myxococcota bacterium]|nr:efflux RND transporter periplasmic adaptor subunit [Myxococcota bacterium]
MKTYSRILPFALLISVLNVTGISCTGSEPQAEETKVETPKNQISLSAAAVKNAQFELAQVEARDLASKLELQGDILLAPEHRASIVAKMPGIVTKIYKKPGDTVKRGEIIALLESRELGDAKMAYLESEHKLKFSKKAVEREKKLLEKNITSKEAFQKTRHALEEAKLKHASALQSLKLLGFNEEML